MSLIAKIYKDSSAAESVIKRWKDLGETVVFTNGCFDILHKGHVMYLEDARLLGSKLIVALNDDESVRNLKGPTRPINNLDGRMHVIASLESVDMVLSFCEKTPLSLIHSIIPDILVKGGDWALDQIVGSDVVLAYGGEVKSIHFVDGFSTTAIETKIKGQ